MCALYGLHRAPPFRLDACGSIFDNSLGCAAPGFAASYDIRVTSGPVLLLLASLASAQDLKVGSIDFFGYEGLDVAAVRAALPLKAGDAFVPSRKQEIVDAATRTLGKPPTDVTFVCCDSEGKGMVYIGLAGHSSVQPNWNAQPSGTARLPEPALRLHQELLDVSAKAVQAGSAREDQAQGYAWSADRATQEKQKALQEFALANEKLVTSVLAGSADAEHRAAAATAAGYIRQSREQAAVLAQASLDPDATVRNNAIRALGVLVRAKPELARGLRAGGLIELIRSGQWTDRNKASFLLLALSQSGDKQIAEAIRARAVPALMEVASWQAAGHAQPARTVLERLKAIPSFHPEEIAAGLGVVYAVAIADVNGDKRPDIVAINNSQLLWFENPTWNKRVVAEKITAADNVALAPREIDGDGKLDFALGADWQSTNTQSGGSLHWVGSEGRVTNIATEPTLHRIGWADVNGDGRAELIVVPLHGRGTKAADWTAGPGARILVFSVPDDPAKDAWPVEVADESLHIVHNFVAVGPEIWTASAEGIHALRRDASGKWSKRLIGEGKPGEIKLGRAGNVRRLATVEPWHGNSVAVYDDSPAVWKRTVIDSNLNQAHALGWGDLDGDKDDELVAGWRGKPWGLAYYKLRGGNWMKFPIDDGVAVEDLAVADLDRDGRPEIVAGGRATGNIRIYRAK